jgi:aryl sulfotransferase
MSYWNFYRDFSPEMITLANSIPGRVGAELEPCPEDIHQLRRNWMTRGGFEWETDGHPFYSVLHHTQSWWDYRQLPNILFIHYGDLLSDMEGEIRRVAHFLEIEPAAAAWPNIIKSCSFAEMKKHGGDLMPVLQRLLKGGTDTFFHKGSNGRWRDVLNSEELKLYDAAAERELTPDCRYWLENGGEV